jgi:hypothetical protein
MLFSPELGCALAEDFRDDTPRFWQCQSEYYAIVCRFCDASLRRCLLNGVIED